MTEAETSSPPKLSIRGLSKSFRKGEQTIEALRDLSVDIRKGEFVGIVGASGCGKTTMLRLIDGLTEPTSGTVLVDGKPLERPGEQLAFVFQQDGLLPWRTVMANTMFGPELQGQNKAQSISTAQRFLRLVGLTQFPRHFPHELSGGMRQRVNLARALTVGADILLMDEPFAALDAQTREIMQAELLRIWTDTRKTVLLVTHQIEEAVFLSDRVLVFTTRPGRLKDEVVIDLPRPRDLSIKRTTAFTRYTDYIWRAIEEEVRRSIDAELEQA
ncbi:MAG: ATP-binding cassette domain-containing protein [Rhizobiales bacterium]|nr:ATP-binding cassette domain-containing protein [Hyphomicrobiales bacterium]